MSNSSLATYIYKTGRCYDRHEINVDRITLHIASTRGGCDALARIIDSSSESSFHYGIAEDGEVGCYVDELYKACDTGNLEQDRKSISITVCNSSLAPNYEISNASYNMLIKLCVDICRRNFIKELTYTGKPAGSNLCMHSWYNTKVNCPGPYLSKKFPDIVKEVNAQLKHVALATSETEALKSQSSVVVDAIAPYVATIAPTAVNVDYRALKLAKVVGCMFWAGSLFATGTSRVRKDKYINNNLKRQVEAAQDVMPYALYCDLRATTVKEAKQELYELYFVISKYPPKLGIWAHLDFSTSNIALNDSILEKYYEEFVKWGLKGKCGIYCTTEQLHKITWTDFAGRLSLWLIDHEKVMGNVSQLLSPSYFKVN